MPKLLAKVEGKGNGIKTVIVNMMEVGKALARPASYPTKFFGCELGAQTQIDKKNDRYIVNGSHNGDKLQEILDQFIEKFVLCEQCDNPETAFIVQPKKEKITSVCAACGHSGQIDMRHRLSTFILKNPPEGDSATPQKMKKVNKANKGDKDKSDKGDSSPNDDDESGFDGWSDDVNVNGKHENGSHDEGIDDWGEDTSEEAVKKRMEGLGQGVKTLTMNNDLEKPIEQRFNIFFNFVKNKINEVNGNQTKKLPDKDIVLEAERLDIKDRAVMVLAELLFNENILEQDLIKTHRTLFLRFLGNNQKAQKNFMGAFEITVGQAFPDALLKNTARILKQFYDLDYVEEEVLLEWGAKVSKKYVAKEISEKIHAKGKPFIDWLKSAEEEDSSDDDEEIEVVYTNRSEAAIIKEDAMKKAMENKPQVANGDEDEELDIDDI